MENMAKKIWTGIGVIILCVIVLASLSQFYYWDTVDEGEIGVVFRQGKIEQIVGPGMYFDTGFWINLEKVYVGATPFQVYDPEVVTNDSQRIGITVAGDAFRYGLGHADFIKEHWGDFSVFFRDDIALEQRLHEIGQQAMKSCVGEKTFDEAVIGQERDVLSSCIQEEMQMRAEAFGINIRNVTVPNVEINEDVQAAMDAIVQERLRTTQAQQLQLRIEAEAEAERSRQVNEIRTQQALEQERSRQQAQLADLEQERLEKEQAVILQQSENDLLQAQKQQEVAEAQREVALLQAQIDNAERAYLANLYGGNPTFASLQLAEINAKALSGVEKFFFIPEGTVPSMVLGEAIPVTPISPRPPD